MSSLRRRSFLTACAAALTFAAFPAGAQSISFWGAPTVPQNLAIPTITGVAAAGNSLSVSNGTWSGASSFAYQWQRNTTGVYADIGGASASTYTVQAADGVNIRCVVTATNATGSAAQLSGPSTYLGMVATGGRMANSANTTNRQFMSRSPHLARQALTSLAIVFVNFYWARASNPGSGALSDHKDHGLASATITAAVEDASGNFTRITFNSGSTSATVGSGLTQVSDTVTLAAPIAAGDQFWIRIYYTSATGIIFNNSGNNVLGRGFTFGVSGVVDQTMGGTVANTDANASTAYTNATLSSNCYGFEPFAIIGNTTLPSICLWGDSREDGFGDTFDSTGDVGEIARMVGASYAYTNLGSYGDSTTFFISGHAGRIVGLNYASHMVCEYGINDVTTGTAVGTIETQLQTMWGYASAIGLPVYQSTIPPVTTSTDGWITTANQTTNANNAARVTLNDWIRTKPAGLTGGYFEVANAVESAQDSGKWSAPPAVTIDGTHENATGYAAIKTAGAITSTSFTR